MSQLTTKIKYNSIHLAMELLHYNKVKNRGKNIIMAV